MILSRQEQEYIPARRYRRFAPERPVVMWTRWERLTLGFALGSVSLMASIVLGALLIAELVVLWAFIA